MPLRTPVAGTEYTAHLGPGLKLYLCEVTAVADGDTLKVPGVDIRHVSISAKDAALVAADAVAATFSGNTITFEMVGTARRQCVAAYVSGN